VGEQQITTPVKKPKNGELTKLQTEENRTLSSNRIFVEHLIRIGSLVLEIIKSAESGQVIDVTMSHSFAIELDLDAYAPY